MVGFYDLLWGVGLPLSVPESCHGLLIYTRIHKMFNVTDGRDRNVGVDFLLLFSSSPYRVWTFLIFTITDVSHMHKYASLPGCRCENVCLYTGVHGWTFWQKVLFFTAPLREMVQALHMTFSSVSQTDNIFTLKLKMWELYKRTATRKFKDFVKFNNFTNQLQISWKQN